MRKLDLNAIYISERVQETLRPVSVSALTAVVAPMGYGKTTAVNWFLNQRKQKCSTFSALSRMEGTAFLLAALSVRNGCCTRHSRFKPVCIL